MQRYRHYWHSVKPHDMFWWFNIAYKYTVTYVHNNSFVYFNTYYNEHTKSEVWEFRLSLLCDRRHVTSNERMKIRKCIECIIAEWLQMRKEIEWVTKMMSFNSDQNFRFYPSDFLYLCRSDSRWKTLNCYCIYRGWVNNIISIVRLVTENTTI